ncbi:MAG: response regulator [Pseudomonadota bacterium]
MRVLIVDDERPARERLQRMLEQEADVKAIAHARDGIEALQMIEAERPDAIFLDIHMPEVSGLEVAASLPAPAPLVVFVTAYDQYAIRAFDANAIDYLLKPFDQERLHRALGRLRARLGTAAPAGSAPATEIGQPLRQLLVSERGTTRIVRLEDLQWIETADNYVVLHTAQGQTLMRQTLSGLLEKLGPAFARCHRRAAVQLGWIERIVALDKGDCELHLRGGASVPCSRQFRAEVEARL